MDSNNTYTEWLPDKCATGAFSTTCKVHRKDCGGPVLRTPWHFRYKIVENKASSHWDKPTCMAWSSNVLPLELSHRKTTCKILFMYFADGTWMLLLQINFVRQSHCVVRILLDVDSKLFRREPMLSTFSHSRCLEHLTSLGIFDAFSVRWKIKCQQSLGIKPKAPACMAWATGALPLGEQWPLPTILFVISWDKMF